jgi:hypothetical protein
MEYLFLFFVLFVIPYSIIKFIIFLWKKNTISGKAHVEKQEKEWQEQQDRNHQAYKAREAKTKKIVCKFCGKAGGVSKSIATVSEESREKGVIGASPIGRKTITKKKVTTLSCKNCGMDWTT